jgi:hypothetical protein
MQISVIVSEDYALAHRKGRYKTNYPRRPVGQPQSGHRLDLGILLLSPVVADNIPGGPAIGVCHPEKRRRSGVRST